MNTLFYGILLLIPLTSIAEVAVVRPNPPNIPAPGRISEVIGNAGALPHSLLTPGLSNLIITPQDLCAPNQTFLSEGEIQSFQRRTGMNGEALRNCLVSRIRQIQNQITQLGQLRLAQSNNESLVRPLRNEADTISHYLYGDRCGAKENSIDSQFSIVLTSNIGENLPTQEIQVRLPVNPRNFNSANLIEDLIRDYASDRRPNGRWNQDSRFDFSEHTVQQQARWRGRPIGPNSPLEQMDQTPSRFLSSFSGSPETRGNALLHLVHYMRHPSFARSTYDSLGRVLNDYNNWANEVTELAQRHLTLNSNVRVSFVQRGHGTNEQVSGWYHALENNPSLTETEQTRIEREMRLYASTHPVEFGAFLRIARGFPRDNKFRRALLKAAFPELPNGTWNATTHQPFVDTADEWASELCMTLAIADAINGRPLTAEEVEQYRAAIANVPATGERPPTSTGRYTATANDSVYHIMDNRMRVLLGNRHGQERFRQPANLHALLAPPPNSPPLLGVLEDNWAELVTTAQNHLADQLALQPYLSGTRPMREEDVNRLSLNNRRYLMMSDHLNDPNTPPGQIPVVRIRNVAEKLAENLRWMDSLILEHNPGLAETIRRNQQDCPTFETQMAAQNSAQRNPAPRDLRGINRFLTHCHNDSLITRSEGQNRVLPYGLWHMALTQSAISRLQNLPPAVFNALEFIVRRSTIEQRVGQAHDACFVWTQASNGQRIGNQQNHPILTGLNKEQITQMIFTPSPALIFQKIFENDSLRTGYLEDLNRRVQAENDPVSRTNMNQLLTFLRARTPSIENQRTSLAFLQQEFHRLGTGNSQPHYREALSLLANLREELTTPVLRYFTCPTINPSRYDAQHIAENFQRERNAETALNHNMPTQPSRALGGIAGSLGMPGNNNPIFVLNPFSLANLDPSHRDRGQLLQRFQRYLNREQPNATASPSLPSHWQTSFRNQNARQPGSEISDALLNRVGSMIQSELDTRPTRPTLPPDWIRNFTWLTPNQFTTIQDFVNRPIPFARRQERLRDLNTLLPELDENSFPEGVVRTAGAVATRAGQIRRLRTFLQNLANNASSYNPSNQLVLPDNWYQTHSLFTPDEQRHIEGLYQRYADHPSRRAAVIPADLAQRLSRLSDQDIDDLLRLEQVLVRNLPARGVQGTQRTFDHVLAKLSPRLIRNELEQIDSAYALYQVSDQEINRLSDLLRRQIRNNGQLTSNWEDHERLARLRLARFTDQANQRRRPGRDNTEDETTLRENATALGAATRGEDLRKIYQDFVAALRQEHQSVFDQATTPEGRRNAATDARRRVMERPNFRELAPLLGQISLIETELRREALGAFIREEQARPGSNEVNWPALFGHFVPTAATGNQPRTPSHPREQEIVQNISRILGHSGPRSGTQATREAEEVFAATSGADWRRDSCPAVQTLAQEASTRWEAIENSQRSYQVQMMDCLAPIEKIRASEERRLSLRTGTLIGQIHLLRFRSQDSEQLLRNLNMTIEALVSTAAFAELPAPRQAEIRANPFPDIQMALRLQSATDPARAESRARRIELRNTINAQFQRDNTNLRDRQRQLEEHQRTITARYRELDESRDQAVEQCSRELQQNTVETQDALVRSLSPQPNPRYPSTPIGNQQAAQERAFLHRYLDITSQGRRLADLFARSEKTAAQIMADPMYRQWRDRVNLGLCGSALVEVPQDFMKNVTQRRNLHQKHNSQLNQLVTRLYERWGIHFSGNDLIWTSADFSKHPIAELQRDLERFSNLQFDQERELNGQAIRRDYWDRLKNQVFGSYITNGRAPRFEMNRLCAVSIEWNEQNQDFSFRFESLPRLREELTTIVQNIDNEINQHENLWNNYLEDQSRWLVQRSEYWDNLAEAPWDIRRFWGVGGNAHNSNEGDAFRAHERRLGDLMTRLNDLGTLTGTNGLGGAHELAARFDTQIGARYRLDNNYLQSRRYAESNARDAHLALTALSLATGTWAARALHTAHGTNGLALMLLKGATGGWNFHEAMDASATLAYDMWGLGGPASPTEHSLRDGGFHTAPSFMLMGPAGRVIGGAVRMANGARVGQALSAPISRLARIGEGITGATLSEGVASSLYEHYENGRSWGDSIRHGGRSGLQMGIMSGMTGGYWATGPWTAGFEHVAALALFDVASQTFEYSVNPGLRQDLAAQNQGLGSLILRTLATNSLYMYPHSFYGGVRGRMGHQLERDLRLIGTEPNQAMSERFRTVGLTPPESLTLDHALRLHGAELDLQRRNGLIGDLLGRPNRERVNEPEIRALGENGLRGFLGTVSGSEFMGSHLRPLRESLLAREGMDPAKFQELATQYFHENFNRRFESMDQAFPIIIDRYVSSLRTELALLQQPPATPTAPATTPTQAQIDRRHAIMAELSQFGAINLFNEPDLSPSVILQTRDTRTAQRFQAAIYANLERLGISGEEFMAYLRTNPPAPNETWRDIISRFQLAPLTGAR